MKNVKIRSFFLGAALLSGGVMASNDARDPKQMTLTQPMVKTLVMETVQQGADTLMVPYHQAVKIGAFNVASNDEDPDSDFPIPNVVFECEEKPMTIGPVAMPRDIQKIEFNQCSRLSILENSFSETFSKQTGRAEGAAKIQEFIINRSQLEKSNCKIRVGCPTATNLISVSNLPHGFLENQAITSIQGLEDVTEIGKDCFFNARFDCRPLVGLIERLQRIPDGSFKCSKFKGKSSLDLSNCATIGSYAFSLCSWLKSVKTSSHKLKQIGQRAFCSTPLRYVCVENKSMTPVKIGIACFEFCARLQSVCFNGDFELKPNVFSGVGTRKAFICELPKMTLGQFCLAIDGAGPRCIFMVPHFL